MSGRAAARRASARIHNALNTGVKLEPDDEQSPHDSSYELENGGDEDQTELEGESSHDLNADQDVAKKPRCTKKIECRSCGKTKPHYARGLCGRCYKRDYLNGKEVECRVCGEVKKHNAHGLCIACYLHKRSTSNEIKCKSCGETKPHRARNLCRACYTREYPRTTKVECKSCGQTTRHHAHGLCYACYQHQYSNGKEVKCKSCGETKKQAARGLCRACYQRQYSNGKKAECKSCGETKKHVAHGLCNKCYCRGNKIECRACGEMKPHSARGLCNACHKREGRKRKTSGAKKRPKAGPSSSTTSPHIQDTSNDDAITLSSASEDETDAVVSSGEEGENYDAKPCVKKEEPDLSSGDEANLKREMDSSSSDDDEEETYEAKSIKQEIKQES